MSFAAVLAMVWLLAGAVAASLTINVEASAINGEWRPSCDDVKNGVVLTNISDGVRAVIEGCTITVDAGSDATKSAVAIAGLGANSSVELIGCSITATFSVNASALANRRAAVHVKPDAVLGSGSKMLLDSTSVSVEETGTGGHSAATLFDSGIVAGEGFQFRVSNHSVLTATCVNQCSGVHFLGTTGSQTSRFGSDAQLTFSDSTLSARSGSHGHGLHMGSMVLGARSALSITGCNVSGTTTSHNAFGMKIDRSTFGNSTAVAVSGGKVSASAGGSDAFSFQVSSTTFGNNVSASIEGCDVMTSAGTYNAYGVYLYAANFGQGGSVSISKGRLVARAATTYAYSVCFSAVNHASSIASPSITVDATHVTAAATKSSAAVLLPTLSSTTVTVSSSVLRTSGQQGSLPSGAITADKFATWSDVRLVVTSSSFDVAASTHNVLWPKTITGVSPQSFDSVIFSGGFAFGVTSGGKGPGPETTLCLRAVRWSSGAAITSYWRFTVPSPMVCWPSLTINVGAAAINGEWRPSCDDVKNGVVLTNISDGVRAVIEGCTITVDAGSDATKSAVAIAGLGANSSVELIGCSITATFSVNASALANRRAAVHVKPDAVLGSGSKMLLDSTSVSVEETGTGGHSAATLFDSGIVAGEGFQFRVSNHSVLTATCVNQCSGVHFLGTTGSQTSRFGSDAQLTFSDSTLSARSGSHGHGLHMGSMVLGARSALSITGCNVSGTTTSHNAFGMKIDRSTFGNSTAVAVSGGKVSASAGGSDAFSFQVSSTTFGNNVSASIEGCDVMTSAGTYNAYGVYLYAANFGQGGSVSISKGRLVARAATTYAYSVCFSAVNHASSIASPSITVDATHVTAAATKSSAAVLLPTLSSTTVTVSSSVLRTSGQQGSLPSGAITADKFATWSDVRLVVTSSSFDVAASTHNVLWPKTITGVSPQSFDSVIFSGGFAFGVTSGGKGPGPETTLCLRAVRWSSGAAITSYWRFTVPSPMVCWPSLTINVGAAAINGEWRPSCDDVKNGVVLTNISDGVRAVIEGCTITVDAGSDATKSAVAIAGLGANSSVELIGCSITATFSVNASALANRRAAVHVKPDAVLGSGSKMLLDSTSVSVEETGTGGHSAATLFDSGIVAGEGFQFRVSNHSVLTATCVNQCSGVHFLGTTGSQTSRFGSDAQLTFSDSTLSARSGSHGHGLHMGSMVLGARSALSITGCNVSGAARRDTACGVSFDWSSSPTFVTRSMSAITIHDARLSSESESGSAALVLPSLSSTVVTVSSSVLRFNASALGIDGFPVAGVIATPNSTAWSNVNASVLSTSFAATNGAAAVASSFVLWPENITGVSRQSFDDVTFSGAGVAPFAIHRGGTGPGPGTTICLHDVRWRNGTAITAPPYFSLGDECRATPEATPTVTSTKSATPAPSTTTTMSTPVSVTSSLRVTRSMTASRSLSTLRSLSVSATASRTAFNTDSPSASATAGLTQSASPTLSLAMSRSLSTRRSLSVSATTSKTAFSTDSPSASGTADLTTSVSRTTVTTTPPRAQEPAEAPRAVPAVATDSARAMEGIAGVSGVVSPLTAGVAVRVATSARASDCTQPSREEPPAPWPLVAKPLSFLHFGLSKTSDPVAYEDMTLIWANCLLFIVAVSLPVVLGVALYFAGSAVTLPGHELRAAAVARLRPGSRGQAAWVAAIATVQVLGGLLVAVVSVLQVPATAAAVSILGNHALMESRAALFLASVTLLVCTCVTIAQCALCEIGKRFWAAAGDPADPDLRSSTSACRRLFRAALDNGAGWQPRSASLGPGPAFGFVAWCHVVGDARGPHVPDTPPATPSLEFELPLMTSALLQPEEYAQAKPQSVAARFAPWRRVALAGAWWLGILEPLVSFLSGVATGMTRAGFCTVGPWAALVLQFVYVIVLVLTWPVKAPALLLTMIAVQALQFASLASDMGLSLAGIDNEAGGTVEAVADWSNLVVAVGLALLGIVAVSVRLPPFYAWVRRTNDRTSRPPTALPPPGDVIDDAGSSSRCEMCSLPSSPQSKASPEGSQLDFRVMSEPPRSEMGFEQLGSEAVEPSDPLSQLLDGPLALLVEQESAELERTGDIADWDWDAAEHSTPSDMIPPPASAFDDDDPVHRVHRKMHRGTVVVEKSGQGAIMVAELEAMLGKSRHPPIDIL